MVPQNSGQACPHSVETRACNTHACPQDCVVGIFGVYTTCTQSCGGGTQSHTRNVTQPVLHGGVACPHNAETRACNTHACPVDCAVSNFGVNTTCSKSCGGGVKTRTRNVTQPSSFGGSPCPHTAETFACNAHPCVKHCVVSNFSAWTTCTTSCGTGAQSRSRSVLQNATLGGYACPYLQETRPCNAHPCPVDCIVGNWGAYGACTKSCGTGSQSRTRAITQPQHGGVACPNDNTDTRACNAHPCPVDCVVGNFSAFSPCTKPCNSGTRTRTRSVITPSTHGGAACANLVEAQACNTAPCSGTYPAHPCGVARSVGATNCTLDGSAIAAGAQSLAQLECCTGSDAQCAAIKANLSAHASCGPELGHCQPPKHHAHHLAHVIGHCDNAACGLRAHERDVMHGLVHFSKRYSRRHKVLYDATADTTLNATTAAGLDAEAHQGPHALHERVAELMVFANRSFVVCHLPSNQARETHCHRVKCYHPVRLHVNYPAASSGNKPKRRRLRNGRVLQAVNETSTQCGPSGTGVRFMNASGVEICNVNLTSALMIDNGVDCVLSNYSAFSPCSVSCGGGNQTKSRSVLVAPANGGALCDPVMQQTQACNTQPCPQHCVVTPFTSWSTCTASCGNGTQIRSRSITTGPAHGGYACPYLQENRACNTHPCPRDCVVTPFSAWSTCTASCGNGTQTRLRSITTSPAHGGVACPSLQENRACNTHLCPRDCVVTPFSAWSTCTASCGNGTQTRSRSITTSPAHGGVACPNLQEDRACSTQACPVHCAVSDFGAPSACSQSCGPGVQTRSRTVLVNASHGGTPCPTLVNVTSCTHGPCPVHCTVSAFSSYTPCTKSCGTGTQSRSRAILHHANHSGYVCPYLADTRNCNVQACPQDCLVGNFTAYSPCSATCGAGVTSRSRLVVVEAAHGGKACPHLVETQACSIAACPVVPVVNTTTAAAPVVNTTTTAAAPPPSDGGGGGVNTAAAAGGGVAGVLAVASLATLCFRTPRGNMNRQQAGGETGSNPRAFLW